MSDAAANATPRSVAPVFLVDDIAATMQWYKRNLGFEGEAVPESPPHNFCILWKDDVVIFLQQLSGYRRPDVYHEREGGVWSAYLRTQGGRALFETRRGLADVTIVHPLHHQYPLEHEEKRAVTTNDPTVAEAQIRTLVDDRTKAIRAKDINRSVSNYAPNVLLFDVVKPLRYTGSDAVRKRVAEWFSLFQGPIGYEIRDLSITAGEGVAFSHYLYRVSGLQGRGKIDMWVRATVCYCENDGKWMITHEHESVPFDVNSGKASLDLEP